MIPIHSVSSVISAETLEELLFESRKEVSRLKSRIADLELEVAGQQKIIDENMGFGSTVEDKRK